MAEYSGLSKEEVKLLSRLEYEKKNIVNREYLLNLLNSDPRKTSNIIYRLVKKGRLKRIKRTKYIVVPMKAPNLLWGENEYVLVDEFMDGKDYYIGYLNAYNFYGFTDQIPQITNVLNAKYSGKKIINNLSFKFIKIPAIRIYGLKDIDINGRKVKISDKERTLVDLIYNPDPVGGIRVAANIFKKNIKNINIEKLINYVSLFANKGTIKRIGFLLSMAGVKNKKLFKLLKIIKNTSVIKFNNNANRSGKINKEWGIIINDEY
ncbi:MAG TPA: type IV toxin-antitoxin system AbiEi family antitoxin [Candidatus Goldiibacteriota bacterium]|nr:type IV toxin-antitoxin system AbiEi family antitoxin [Candidatus Goldiibacteriota bacterium]